MKKIIPFPLVFYRLGTIFHFDKNCSKTVLKILERKRLIEIIPFKMITQRKLSGLEQLVESRIINYQKKS